MTENPLFSVLIANYNNSKYLMDAVDSVRAQTYSNWEIILVDDGSTDNAEEVYTKLSSEERIHISRNKSNKGCGYTKKKCVELAQGEICGFLDADDKLTDDALATMVNAHQQHPKCSLIYSQFYYTDNKLHIDRISSHQCSLANDDSFLTHKATGAISHFATFKLSSYKKTEGISPIMQRAVDIDLYLKLEEAGLLQFIAKPLYYYRCGTEKNISLGEINSTKALYWDFFARTNACIRRGLPAEQISFPRMEEKDAALNSQQVRKVLEYGRKRKVYHKLITACLLLIEIIDRTTWRKASSQS